MTALDATIFEREHSPLGPSASDRWMNCPGSVLLTLDYPDSSSVYAEEGTFAHLVSEWCRVHNKPAEAYIGTMSDCGKFEVTPLFAAQVQMYLDYLYDFGAGEVGAWYEMRVTYDAWVPFGFGKADDIRIDPGQRVCQVTDLKFGEGVKVNTGNQNRCYALGVFQDMGHLYDIDRFKLVVHQPRLDHVSEEEISTKELILWAQDEAKPAAEEAIQPGATFKAGSHCRWCPARADCSYRAQYNLEVMAGEMDNLEKDPDTGFSNATSIPDEVLGKLFGELDNIRSWANAVEERTLSRVQARHEIIGPDGLPLKMVAGRSGARSWKDKVEAEKALRGTKLKVKEILPPSLISPTQAEKMLGKKHPVLGPDLVSKSKGKPVLVLGSDPRPAYAVSSDEMDDLEEVDELKDKLTQSTQESSDAD